MNILGIYGAFYWDANNERNEWIHDSGATIFKNGNHIVSISEERLSKVKYEGNYPARSISYCLDAANLQAKDIDLICVPAMCCFRFYEQLNDNIIYKKLKDTFINAKIEIIGHHLSHAAASVFSSPFKKGTFLTIDGAGSLQFDYFGNLISHETSSVGYFDKDLGILRVYPDSNKGNQVITNHYWISSHKIYNLKTNKNINLYDPKYRESFCGKIMGLSAYGYPEKYKEKTYKVLNHLSFPTLAFDGDFNYLNEIESPDDMAAVLQKNTEEGILEYVTELRKDYLDEYTCFSGGFFLNILANTIIKNSGLFKEIYIPPFTSDCGLHFGAACYGLFKHKQKINLPKNVALLGKEYNESEIYNEVKNLKHKKYNNFNQLCAETSKLLNENKIIGWFQGKSEFGPRALGSRSILMNPSKKEHKDVINERVKHREYWRPFAGIILDEYLKDYFEDNIQNPYMIYSQTVKSDKKDQLSAIIHEDDTCRIQTVNSELNDKVTTLLKEYHKISGVPVLLNTSFNDNGQPIVETPKDAVDAFLNLDIDYLVIENYIVEK